MALNVVSNAGNLMVFSKLNILHLLKKLYGRVEFPLSVYREIVSAGIRRGFADAQILNSFLLQNNWKPVRGFWKPSHKTFLRWWLISFSVIKTMNPSTRQIFS